MQTISAVALVVRDYDEAIHFFTHCLRFAVVEHTALSPLKRWVVVRPPGGGTALLLAKAASPEQAARVAESHTGRYLARALTLTNVRTILPPHGTRPADHQRRADARGDPRRGAQGRKQDGA